MTDKTTDQLTFRRANNEDVQGVVGLQKQLAAASHHPTESDAWVDNAIRFYAHPNAMPMVAVDPSGDVVATGVGTITQIQPAYWLPDGRVGYLQSFFVNVEWRGHGVASEVLRCLLEWFGSQQVLRVNAHVIDDAGAGFFAHHGFTHSIDQNIWIKLDQN